MSTPIAANVPGPPPRQVEATLVSRVVDGDVEAMAQLEKYLAPVLRARTRRFLARQSQHAVASEMQEDLCQHVWVALMRNNWAPLRAFQAEHGVGLTTYVGAIADKECLQRRRELSAKKRASGARPVALQEVEVPAGARATDPEHRLEKKQLLAGLMAHLDGTLPPRGRLVLRLLYEDAMAAADAAQFMGVAPQVVYNWQHRIRRLSRDYMAALDGQAG